MPSSLASRDKLESHCPQDLSLRNCDAELWWPLLGAMRGCTILWGGRCCGAAWRPLLTPSSLLLRLCSSSETFWLNSLPPPLDLAKWVSLFVFCLSVYLSVCLSVCLYMWAGTRHTRAGWCAKGSADVPAEYLLQCTSHFHACLPVATRLGHC